MFTMNSLNYSKGLAQRKSLYVSAVMLRSGVNSSCQFAAQEGNNAMLIHCQKVASKLLKIKIRNTAKHH